MSGPIFYSWQNTTAPRANRYLIRDALSRAAKRLTKPLEVDEATRGVPGTAPIFETIQKKIDRCSIFVADLSLAFSAGENRLCNPNVLIEYGYALARVGDKHVIPVMNTAFGPTEGLPFDLRHKVVRARYELNPEANSDQSKKARSHLEGILFRELREVLENPGSSLNISAAEERVVLYILDSSRMGRGFTYHDIDDIQKGLGLSSEEAGAAVAELVSRGYLERLSSTNAVHASVGLFMDFDRFVHGWDPFEDARTIAKATVETSDSGQGRLGTEKFSEDMGWSFRRMNPALLVLDRYCAVGMSKSTHDSDLFTSTVFETEATRSFIRREVGGARRGSD